MVNEITTDASNEDYQTSEPLGRLSILSYGSGHMLNDITSACWFTYLLLFLTDIGLTPRDAAIVMLAGQTADAFTTIFVGELIDRFGHFKIWHAGGSVLVAISFSSVFGGCIPCKILKTDSSELERFAQLETIGYCFFAAVFNVGWAVTQVSHMAMVNCITLNPTSRVSLASCRNAFTMVANLSLYAVALAVFTVFNNSESVDVILQYRWIAYLSIFLGCCFVIVFLIGTKEPKLKQEIQCKRLSRISWAHWFKKALYYQVALVYMLTRLVTNVSQSLLAFYVINDLGMGNSSKASVPAIIYICSFVISIVLQEMKWSSWRIKSFFTIGAILWIFSGLAIFVLPSNLKYLMYILSISIGTANALMTVTAISMESILVGEDLNGCAFVYGSLSFVDKLSCGIALYALESYQVTPDVKGGYNYLQGAIHSVDRIGLGLIPSACALIALVVTFTMDLQHRRPKMLTEPLLV
ncbi:hypothetical protein LUZ60_005212 [Juncus effusus]|nr:hypothetical protein LUZ60_005212 [Juncus effusus]